MKSLRVDAVGMAAALLLAGAPGMVQGQMTGSSKAPAAMIEATPDVDQPAAEVAPRAAEVAEPVRRATADMYLPYTQTGGDPAAVADAPRRALTADPDAGIVTYVPSAAGEVPDGTMVKVKLRETLSTERTKAGSLFSAEVVEPVIRDGRVVVPVGAVLEGRVTWLRGGSRISGGAAIHLEAQRVMLPDGSQYALHARVIDTSSWDNTKVDSEGTIKRKDHAKATLAVMGMTTGTAAVAGAMIGGPPGALIGAGVGAGLSTVVWLRQDRQAELPKDLGVVFSLTVPMVVAPASAAVGTAMVGIPGGE